MPFNGPLEQVGAGEPSAQEEAIDTAETVFHYVAESYLQVLATVAVDPPKAAPKPPLRTSFFLASACSFQRPTTTATSGTSMLKRTPQEDLVDELNRYLRFESAPLEGGDHSIGEPLAEEVLVNPLLWWKVSTYYSPHLS